MIDLTDYHVSRTLGYIDTYIRFPDAIGGMVTPPPIKVTISPAIRAQLDQLDALIAADIETQLRARQGADQTLTVTPVALPATPVQEAPANG